MEQVAIFAFQIGFSFAIFVLISLGLAVIFGMMRVINLAQGEFLMLGAYVSTITANAGVNIWLSMVLATFAVGLFGVVVERIIIRHLYGRIVDTLLATWGLSLFLVGGVTTLLGPQTESVSVSLGNVTTGTYSISIYSLVLILANASRPQAERCMGWLKAASTSIRVGDEAAPPSPPR